MSTPNPQQLPEPTTLLAALMTMMTRFSCLGCPQLAARIRRHLALLRHYDDKDMPPLLKQLAQRLEGEWAQLLLAISDTPPHNETNDYPTHTASQSLH